MCSIWSISQCSSKLIYLDLNSLSSNSLRWVQRCRWDWGVWFKRRILIWYRWERFKLAAACPGFCQVCLRAASVERTKAERNVLHGARLWRVYVTGWVWKGIRCLMVGWDRASLVLSSSCWTMRGVKSERDLRYEARCREKESRQTESEKQQPNSGSGDNRRETSFVEVGLSRDPRAGAMTSEVRKDETLFVSFCVRWPVNRAQLN